MKKKKKNRLVKEKKERLVILLGFGESQKRVKPMDPETNLGLGIVSQLRRKRRV